MSKIRDYKFKKIGKKVYLGFEIDSANACYYNNQVVVNFIKEGQVIDKKEIEIPMIPEDSILYIGKSFEVKEIDDIKLEIKDGKHSFEESFYPYVNFSMDTEKTNEKHLEYKIENNSNKTLDYAVLNFLFYDRGEIICGDSVEITNILNGRTYYFVYDIPKEIEYTDIKTELILPNTNRLLFRGFYDEYLTLAEEIMKVNTPIKQKEHEKFYDNTDELNKDLNAAKKKKKEISHYAAEGSKRAYYFFQSIPYLFISLVKGALGFGIGLLVGGAINLLTGKDWIFYLGMIGGYIIGVIYFFIKTWSDNSYKVPEFSTKKEKEADMAAQDVKIAKLEADIKDITENKEKYKVDVEKRNKQIDEENKKLLVLEKKRSEKFDELCAKQDRLCAAYPKYAEVTEYDDIDKALIDQAIRAGAVTLESAENYRSICRAKIDADQKFQEEMKMRRREQELLEAQTEAIKQSAWEQQYNANMISAEIAKQTSQYATIAQQQIAASDKLYRQREYLGNQTNITLNEIRNLQSQDMTYYR